jgi:hypothetical protein
MIGQAVAQRFGDCLVRRDHDGAWSLLARDLQASISPAAIRDAVATMTAYASSPLLEAQVMEDFALEDWPGKQPGDLAIHYVALNGDGFSEAVTLTVAQYANEVLIGRLEWGRP